MAARFVVAASAGVLASVFGAGLLAVSCREKRLSLDEAVRKSSDLCRRLKEESGSPGLVVAVSVDGVNVFEKGI